MKIKLPAIFATISLILILGGYFLFQFLPDPKSTNITKDHSLMSDAEVETYFRENGSVKSYREFKERYITKSPYEQHSLIHHIGQVIYKVDKMSGAAVCDSSFAYGCYHGFFAEAIKDIGIDNLELVNKKCLELTESAKVNCQHGLGHGVLAYLGASKLPESVEVCSGLSGERSDIRCLNGVFMEFNFNTMSHSNTVVRELDPEKPYYPCSEMPDKYKSTCFYSQGEWWNQVYRGDYQKMGELCKDLTKSFEQQKMCYLGVGWSAAHSSLFSVDETINKCEKMPKGDAELLCKKGATVTFKLSALERGISERDIKLICETVAVGNFSECYE